MQSSLLSKALIRRGLVSAHFLNYLHYNSDAELFDALCSRHCVSEKALHELCHEEFGFELSVLEQLVIDLNCLPTATKSGTCIPLNETQEQLYVAVSNPFLDLGLESNKPIKKLLIPKQDLLRYFSDDNTQLTLTSIIHMAIKQDASDIHFFQNEDKGYAVSFRCASLLKPALYLQPDKAAQLLQQVKLDAHMDLGFHTSPQDGQLSVTHKNQHLNIRVATFPSYYGEDISLRLFKEQSHCLAFKDLGMSDEVSAHIKHICKQRSGLLLITGPTGSGKSTTLYSILKYLQSSYNKVVVTLEDPVEKNLYGIRQASIKPEQGFDFARGLKAVLRQDPDIIMIGEIRDEDTAKLAIQAAYTGHLVLSTLHTADVRSSLYRLKSLGCDPFLLQYALRGIISQQLQLIPCDHCSQSDEAQCEQCNGLKVSGRRLAQQSLLMQKQQSDTALFDCEDLNELGQFVNDGFSYEEHSLV